MALTNWNDILNKPNGIDEVPEIALTVEQLSASVLSLGEDVGEIAGDVLEITQDILKDVEFINITNSSDGITYTQTFSEIAPNTRFPFIVLKAHQISTPSNPIVWCCINNVGTPAFLTTDSTNVQFNFETKTISVTNGANSWSMPIMLIPKGLLKV